MAKILTAKCKLCRRAAEKLFLKGERCNTAKCAMVKRNYPPGPHGVKGKPRISEYGKQLIEKQKAKRIYGVLEKQFRNYYDKAKRKVGDTGEIMLQLLEMRLDNVIYHVGLADSRSLARQRVSHGFFTVNGKKVRIPSYQLKVGDKIAINPHKSESKVIKELAEKTAKKEIPGWLNFDQQAMEIKVVSKPKKDDLKQAIEMRLIVEYYSR